MIITLKNGKTFVAKPTQSLLDAAQAAGLPLEYSCKTGRCGICRAPRPVGVTRILQPESAPEATEQTILTCCRAAEESLFLDLEDLGELAKYEPKTLPCRIVSIERLSEDTVEVWLRTPPTGKLDYLPGQYINVIGPGGVRRAYSVANAPRADGQLSLLIRRVKNGQMSAYWFDKAKAGDLLRLNGPLGTFHLRRNRAKELIFLATGTGIAPIRGFLGATLPASWNPKIRVYWGNRTEQDIVWDDTRFIPVLSRADAEWSGRRGYVQAALTDDGFDAGTSTVYACGSPTMIRDAHRLLMTAGLPTENFHSDAFVSSESANR